MHRSLRFRLGAAILALLTCLSTPIVALGHGHAHAHIAAAHLLDADSRSGSHHPDDALHADHVADAHDDRSADHDDRSADHDGSSIGPADSSAYDGVAADAEGIGTSRASHHDHGTTPRVESSTREHAHGHAAMGTAATARGESRTLSPVSAPIAEPARFERLTARRSIDVVAWKDAAQLARPGPDTGPYAGPRAPPDR